MSDHLYSDHLHLQGGQFFSGLSHIHVAADIGSSAVASACGLMGLTAFMKMMVAASQVRRQ